MGSNQSSAGDATSDSFSIDPNGNITRSQATSSKARVPSSTDGATFTKDDANNSIQSTAHSNEEPKPFIMAQVPESQNNQTRDRPVTLTEAEKVVTALKEKYKPDSLEMAGKRHSVFEDVERNLLQCYQANKHQTMNCSKAYQEYKEFVGQKRGQVLKNSPLLSTITVIVVLSCILLHLISPIACIGVMSIDMGSEWMKVGLMSPGIPMDIVLNAQSQRKTPMAIAFSNNERFIGETALDIASKYPERTYTHFLDLVGKTVDHESVKHYKQRFPYAKISELSSQPGDKKSTTNPSSACRQSPESLNSIVMNHPQGLEFTPLELVAMMLEHAHDQVVARSNSIDPPTDVVITVPPFFSPCERLVIQQAAQLVGLNVLRLTSTNAAFALSYGIYRHNDYKPIAEGPDSNDISNRTSIVFFDQGASHSSATLADYYMSEQVINGKNESFPTIRIRAQAYDRYFGGFDMQLRLRDQLAESFAKTAGVDKKRIMQRGRSAAKLLKEAGKVKKILSANTEHVARVENVIDDKDLRQLITRQEFEELSGDLLSKKLIDLLDGLFKMPGVNRDDPIESVIIVGGNTRTPKIQQTLLDYFKLETLGKSINADEGAALAALYQAASLGRGFRVKKFVLLEFGETINGPASSTAESTTTTQAPVTSSDPSMDATGSSSSSTTSIPSTTTTTTSRPRIDHLSGSRKKLANLREQDHLRLQRLSLRNSLESLLSEARQKLTNKQEEIEQRQGEKEGTSMEKDQIQNDRQEIEEQLRQVSEAYTWLEDGPQGETDNVTMLADKIQVIRDLVFPRPPPPPPPVDGSAFDLSKFNLSQFINNDTLKILKDLKNLTNPFGASASEQASETFDLDPKESSTSEATGEPSLTEKPAPATEKPQDGNDQKSGPPPHNEL